MHYFVFSVKSSRLRGVLLGLGGPALEGSVGVGWASGPPIEPQGTLHGELTWSYVSTRVKFLFLLRRVRVREYSYQIGMIT